MASSIFTAFDPAEAGVRIEGSAALQQSLEIDPPDSAINSPPALSFQRKREVEIPWDRLGHVDAAGALRAHFEAAWGVDDPARLWQDGKGPLDDPQRLRAVPPNPPAFFRTNFSVANLSEPVTRGFAIRHGSSGRWYLLADSADQPLAADDFGTCERYLQAWGKVEGIELIFDRAEDAARYYTEFQEIDLRPALIARRYEELALLQGFTQAVKASVAAATGRLVDRIVSTSMNSDELEALQQRVLRLEMEDFDVRRQIDRLVADAGRLGFLLFNEAAERQVTGADGKPLQLRRGKLYTTMRRTVTWTDYVSVRPHWWSSRRLVAVAQEKVVDAYQEVDLLRDLVSEKRSAWLREGRQVFVFEKTPAGFVTADGRTLRQVMDLCLNDEAFRRQCVVLLPVVEDSLTGQRLLTKYAVFLRPLPGTLPTSPPRLALTESLSYRVAWSGTHLGELVSSINLAPGEERQVKITRRFEQETTVSRSSTSMFELSRSESNDLSSEMESQTRREQESSSNMQFSTSVSGSYFGCTAEASASGGTSSSLKDFSQAINKVAKKASQAVNRQNKEEVSVSSSSRTTVSNTDETTATLRNINQGRSLNLMFYRLHNRFEGGLFLDALGFEVLTGVEAIAGSGVHEARSFGLEALPKVVQLLRAAGLGTSVAEGACAREIVGSIRGLLDAEYASAPPTRLPGLRERFGAAPGPGEVRLFATEPVVPLDADEATSVQRVVLPP
ncbi:MAG: hypothetical protein J0L57_18260, partial [Burkholderiales bacterium]|nr:hypothetical protein [Burkholderiales bacterium]